ncbi:MAG: hypothetical protein HS113_02245 [Verrucomicrobiales bacterium]|nr:hypothetical protein [Verrucomicrobiales bacterium]
MKLPRPTPEPGALVDFYQQALSGLGAACERTWYDRLTVLADGAAARLWNDTGELSETELSFPAPDAPGARDPHREVFPGCPLTFRLADLLRPSPLPLETVVLASDNPQRPGLETVERAWRVQFPGTTRWSLRTPLTAAHHFSLLALLRCEIQAIDQHWSLHRLALSLPHGTPDPELATGLALAQTDPAPGREIAWPPAEPGSWASYLEAALAPELAPELAPIRERQQQYLRRELERIDDYFGRYELELTGRASRSSSEASRLKLADRLAATRTEHARRRSDQVARHEIRVVAHVDALLLVAERAWHAELDVVRDHAAQQLDARWVPRTRRWAIA